LRERHHKEVLKPVQKGSVAARENRIVLRVTFLSEKRNVLSFRIGRSN
jgi:hypothetical protein